VVAIRRDSMDIRWEDGEEISTSISLQQRIIERMRHEKELEKEQTTLNARKSKVSGSKTGKQFSGLEASDFTSAVSRTRWRGRGQLGGAVARAFKTSRYRFNSWAVMQNPEVHWLDVKRQKREDLPLQAKFYARMEDQHLCFGFHTPHPGLSFSENNDWQALMAWLDKESNDSWLRKQCHLHDLYICDQSKQGFAGRLEVKNDQWEHCEPDKRGARVETLIGFLSAAGKSGSLDLRIETRLGKNAAIEKRQGIADKMAAVFESLMPLYAAAADRTV